MSDTYDDYAGIEESRDEGRIYVETAEELKALVEQRAKQRQKERFDPLMGSDKTDWGTPDWFFKALDNEFHFDLDAAASMENRKVKKFFSIQQDAFRLQWLGSVFLNCPYGRGIDRWMKKARSESILHDSTVICLIPARPDTNWWFDSVRHGEVRFLKGRLKFEGAPTSAPFPSALVIYANNRPPSTSYWHYKQLKFSPFYEAVRLG